MKYLFILLIMLFSLGGYSQDNLVKIGQVDIFTRDSILYFEVTKDKTFRNDDEVLELIFRLYVLENTEADIIKKVKFLNRSDLVATKPGEKKPQTMKL